MIRDVISTVRMCFSQWLSFRPLRYLDGDNFESSTTAAGVIVEHHVVRGATVRNRDTKPINHLTLEHRVQAVSHCMDVLDSYSPVWLVRGAP